ncbi:MAG: UvrD-helicase domain-containing protein [Clostridia bacterium]|nr:UvrD-helicase domain-containing protein [Clostridia bacterium]
MAERIWTPAQRAAIDTRDRTLLVSAAAGSGKTATLTERIISSLIDPAHPADLSRMLVVTFTKKAAAELRERIEAALTDALRRDPENQRLARQLVLLPSAHVSTIDSYCNFIVKQNAAALGISPTFRVSDEAERALLMHTVMDELIDALFAGELPSVDGDAFAVFAADLVSARSEAELADVLISTYVTLQGQEDPLGVLSKNAKSYASEKDAPIFSTRAGGFIKDRTEQLLAHYTKALPTLLDCIRDECNELFTKYIPKIEEYLHALSLLQAALSDGYTAVREQLRELKFPTLPSAKRGSEKPPSAVALDGFCKSLRDTLKALLSRQYAYTEEQWHDSYAALADRMALLLEVLSLFDARFLAEKQRRGVLDFSDVERLTYRLFYDDGEPSSIARAVGEGLDAIYIDEYQDVNVIQHKIFEAISKPRNRFMVGDIKQSIYSFRHAEPSIFADLRAKFPPLSEAGDAASIFMSNNFRCDRVVIDLVNDIFTPLFTLAGDSIGYTADDNLIFSKKYELPPQDTPVTTALFFRDDQPTEKDPVAEVKEISAEAAWVAEEISRLLESGARLQDGKQIEPSDIAILLRTGKEKTAIYARALRARGLDSTADENTEFFINPEILLALSLLNAIDNPHRDIYLAGLLHSPLFSFSMEEMMELRRLGDADRSRSLYDTLLSYHAEKPNEKCEKLIRFLEKWRARAEGMPVDRLLRELYSETGLLSMHADGSGRRQNLLLLYNYARRFEAGSYKGLYNFIAYINEIVAAGKRFADIKSPSESSRAISILTMHKSKGLEFPVVFVCDCGTRFNRPHQKQNLVYHPALGLAMRMNDESGVVSIEHPARFAVLDAIDISQNEEELRVLYVALTRARERLYITGSVNKRPEEYRAEIAQAARTLSRETVLHGANSLFWMLAATGGMPGGRAPLCLSGNGPAEKKTAVAAEGTPTVAEDPALTTLLSERFAYRYPYAHMLGVPRKISVSHLYPSVLDEMEEDAPPPAESDAPFVPTRPAFLGGDDGKESARRGTATHLYLQFCDLSSLQRTGAAAELSRLTEKGFLTREDAARVRLDEIEAFCASRTFAELLAATELHRETRFHITLPASEFTAVGEKRALLAGETLTVQGVMDCVYRRADGGLVLLDYKTDRLTREELNDRALARERLVSRHGGQLSYYVKACVSLFGQAPDEVLIYSLPLGDSIKL